MISEIVNTELPHSGHRTWRHGYVLLPILVVYLVLASYGLDYQSLWKDEILSVRDAASSTTIWSKGQGPLHFALLHVWMNLTQTDGGLRTLSVLIGAVAVCLFYVTAVTLTNRRAAWVGTLLFATSPFVIWYSQEVRYIILMLATTLLGTYTFRWLTPRGGVVQWFAYGGAILLAIASFVSNIFFASGARALSFMVAVEAPTVRRLATLYGAGGHPCWGVGRQQIFQAGDRQSQRC